MGQSPLSSDHRTGTGNREQGTGNREPAVYFWLNDRRMTAVGLGAFGLLTLIAVVDMGVSRLSLEADALRVVSLFSRKQYERHNIERVTWEGGAGVAIQLKDGTWVKLPDLARNSQSTTNTIRAWLKR